MTATNATIDQILQADRLACQNVTAAQDAADKVRAEARQQAEALAVSQKAQLAGAVAGEVTSILSEAQSRARQIGSETDAYLERLHRRKVECLDELVARLVDKVIDR